MAKKEVVVIGCGKFGREIIRGLANQKTFNIIAIDKYEDKLKEVATLVKESIIADITKKDIVETIGIKGADIFVISLGDNIESSLLINAIIRENNPKARIISKATNSTQAEILRKLNIEEIINPNEIASKRALLKIINPHMSTNDTQGEIFEEIPGGFSVSKTPIPDYWDGQRVIDLKLPIGKLSIILYYRNNVPQIVSGFTELKKDDSVLIIGKTKYILQFLKLKKNIDKPSVKKQKKLDPFELKTKREKMLKDYFSKITK